MFDTVKSYQASFKLGFVGSSVGTITQDRTQGVMGEVGLEIDLFNTDISVSAADGSPMGSFKTDLVKENDLIGSLAYATIMETIT